MENAEITVLDEKESGLVKMLENFGLSGSAARIIIYLAVHADSTIREIGASTGLSTAAVSIALKKLRAERIVRRRKADETKRNAPLQFCLTGDFNHVLSIIEEKKRKEVYQYIRKTAIIKKQSAGQFQPRTS